MIDRFRGKYFFLSNMFNMNITMGGKEYTCTEAVFQSFKTKDMDERAKFAGLSGKEAKRLGRSVSLRPDWDKIKVEVMKWVIHQKFQNPELRQLLIDTGDEELVEGNTWGDTFWGVCNGYGKNMLGKILMEERESIRNGK
jgi:hypothetical protein